MTELVIWKEENSVQEIKKIFAPTLTDGEFKTFVEMGRALSLNPFLKEIWAVKFGNSAAQIFVGRDGYRKNARLHPKYDYHYTEAVYSNDFFEAKDGIYNHKFNIKDRGELVGSYTVIKRLDSSRPVSLFISFKEYDLKQSLWKTKPETMCKKVSESQGLRMVFPEIFQGTYDESEFDEDEFSRNNSNTNFKKQKPELPKIENNEMIIEAEGTDTKPSNPIKFGESKEDKKLILEKSTQISTAFSIDASKNEELIKKVCRLALTKEDLSPKSIDMIISQIYYDIKKNRPEEIIK